MGSEKQNPRRDDHDRDNDPSFGFFKNKKGRVYSKG